MKWKCKKCGACCEILYPLFFGKCCKQNDKDKRLCKIYEERPPICRVSHIFGEEVTVRACELLRKARR